MEKLSNRAAYAALTLSRQTKSWMLRLRPSSYRWIFDLLLITKPPSSPNSRPSVPQYLDNPLILIMVPTVVFISGANRGLGLGLLQRYLAQPSHTVIAGNRDPTHPSSRALADLPRGDGSRLIVVKLDASVDQDAFAAIQELQEKHDIDHLDIVIANAGISYAWPSVAQLKLDDLRNHISPNVYGFIALYQATRALMQKSSREPIFSPIGSIAGCITCLPLPIDPNLSP